MLNGFKNPGRVALIGGQSEIGLSIVTQLPEDKSREIVLIGRSGDYVLDVNDSKLSTTENLLAAIDVNFLSTVHLLELISDRMKRQAHGTILVISSFAQVRPRDDNFRYGSTKAGLDFYARGLASTLKGSGVTLKILRPGFVKSKMTEGMEIAPFAITVQQCGKYGVAALKSRDLVTWAPSILKYVARIFKSLPPSVYRKISHR